MQDDWACGGAARMFFNDCGCGCIANDPSVCAEDEVLHEPEYLERFRPGALSPRGGTGRRAALRLGLGGHPPTAEGRSSAVPWGGGQASACSLR